jgi:hypothetical protein
MLSSRRMSSTRAGYQGYVIEAHPFQLADDGRWSTDLNIERHDGEGVSVAPYSGALTFATKDEAIQHCLGLGAQIIDGAYPGCVAP